MSTDCAVLTMPIWDAVRDSAMVCDLGSVNPLPMATPARRERSAEHHARSTRLNGTALEVACRHASDGDHR